MQEEQKGSQEKKEQNNEFHESREISSVEKSETDIDSQITEEVEIEEEIFQRRGCLRGCLTPLIVIFAILLIVIMVVYTKRNSIHDILLKRIVMNTQSHVTAILPEDMDRIEVDELFENVKIALRENRIDETALTGVITEYHDAMKKEPSSERKKQEIEKLMAGLRGAIATGSP